MAGCQLGLALHLVEIGESLVGACVVGGFCEHAVEQDRSGRAGFVLRQELSEFVANLKVFGIQVELVFQ